MSDLVARLRDSVRAARALDRSELLAEAADEIERLRSRVRFCDNVIRSGDVATLTDAEREAVERVSVAYDLLPTEGAQQVSATLRGLLERLK